MSVPNQIPYISYNANGLTTVFPFEFYTITASDIQISINGEAVTSGFTVSGVGNVSGGDVVFLTPPASGAVVMLERVVPTYRLTDYQDNGDLLADTVNKDFDRLWMAIQRYGIHLGLALRRPLFGGPFNAEGYRIEKLADPVSNQDAATKNYVDNVSLIRALRVPEASVNALPGVVKRAGKLLGFDSAGEPVAVLPESGSATDVLLQLAAKDGASLIGQCIDINDLRSTEPTYSGQKILLKHYSADTGLGGGVFQSIMSADSYIDDGGCILKTSSGNAWVRVECNIVNPFMYGAYGNNINDDTDAINAAFASGKPVAGDGTYYATGIILAKGQSVVGTFKVNTSRYSLGDVDMSTANTDFTSFKGMYVESAYDLCELMYIKNMGINTILHYGHFAASTQDKEGTIQNVLDNCQTAGIRCIVGTEAGEAAIDLNTFIDKYRHHPAVLGWTAYDEPMSRGISYATQRTKVDLIRARTNKPIAVVDSWHGSDVISNLILEDYDIVLADPYSVRRSSGTLGERIAADLDRMRRSYGGMQAHSRNKSVIPVIGAFTTSSGAGTSDVNQILGAAETFRKSGNGSFACFVWDGSGDPTITSGIRGKSEFLSLVKASCEAKYQVPYDTESLVFGGNNTTGHRPLNALLDRIVQKDLSTSDAFMGTNAYPVQVVTDTTETDRSTLETGWNVSGIGFKRTLGTLVTNIEIRSNLLLYGEYNTILGNVNGTVSLLGSYDGGYSLLQRGAQNVNGNSAIIDMSITTPNKNERLCIRTAAVIDSNYYRRFIKGLIVSTDW